MYHVEESRQMADYAKASAGVNPYDLDRAQCYSLIGEYKERVRKLEARVAHVDFMEKHGAEPQPRIVGYNTWPDDGWRGGWRREVAA